MQRIERSDWGIRDISSEAVASSRRAGAEFRAHALECAAYPAGPAAKWRDVTVLGHDVPVLACDFFTGEIVTLNRRMCELLAEIPRALIGQGIWDIIPQNRERYAMALREVLWTRGTLEGAASFTLLRRNGRLIDRSMRGRLFIDQGRFLTCKYFFC